MRHRRSIIKKTEKEKENLLVIEAAALAAAKATVEAIKHQEEEDDNYGFSGFFHLGQRAWELDELDTYLSHEREQANLNLPEHIRIEILHNLRGVSAIPEPRLALIKKAGYVRVDPIAHERINLFYRDFFAKKREVPEVPVMTKVALSALSDRMYAVTLEEMQEELYDDAE